MFSLTAENYTLNLGGISRKQYNVKDEEPSTC